MAVEDAGIAESTRCATVPALISIGTTDGESQRPGPAGRGRRSTAGPSGWTPRVARRVPAGRLSAAIAQEFGLTGAEAVTIPTACAAGNYAIGYGYDADPRRARWTFALCGGADAMCRKTFTGFYRLGTIAPERCQPFDVDRKGILTGEGAGVLVLETPGLGAGAAAPASTPRSSATGSTATPTTRSRPNQDSVARCMRLALRQRRRQAGRGRLHLRARHRHQGQRHHRGAAPSARSSATRPPRTVSIKSMIGHTMGAASALGRDRLRAGHHRAASSRPPSTTSRPTRSATSTACPTRRVEADLRIVQNNGLAFGGNNAVVILRRARHDAIKEPS